MEDPMKIGRGVAIPLSEIELRASRSSGPGGQHANVTASRIEAIFDASASRSLDEEQRRRITARCGPVVRAVAQDTRSQARNRELALERLRSRLASALAVQRPRRATRPSAASRRRRVDSKRRRGELKRQRRRPQDWS
jgi:ribosome-associated protein